MMIIREDTPLDMDTRDLEEQLQDNLTNQHEAKQEIALWTEELTALQAGAERIVEKIRASHPDIPYPKEGKYTPSVCYNPYTGEWYVRVAIDGQFAEIKSHIEYLDADGAAVYLQELMASLLSS